MFDKASRNEALVPPRRRSAARPEDERIALRCNARELELLDAMVSEGGFSSRSSLMREILRDYLRSRALPGESHGSAERDARFAEVTVRLRPDEVETISAYGELVGNGQELRDLLAQLVRHGEQELRVSETVARSRASVKAGAESRRRAQELRESAAELERRGVVGR